jgi:hypothetical protein
MGSAQRGVVPSADAIASKEIAGVVRAYQQCREALAKGLGVSPSIETERVHLEAVHGTSRFDQTPRIMQA